MLIFRSNELLCFSVSSVGSVVKKRGFFLTMYEAVKTNKGSS